jgi:hypothetical protein
MTQATPVTIQSKKDTRKTCSVCKKKYYTAHRSTLTCSDECKRTRRNKSAKITTQKTRKPKAFPISNPFVQLLLRHAKQAGTVQIVQGISDIQLLELREMHKTQQAANSWTVGKFGQFQFSHIYPARGQAHIGKFVPENLVIASGELNRKHGCQWLGGGSHITTEEFDAQWIITEGMSDLDIMTLMVHCIGLDTWNGFNKVAKLAPSERQTIIEKLEALLDRNNPEHAAWIKIYDNLNISTPDLSALLESVTGREPFRPISKFISPMDLMISETRRLMVYRPELSSVLKALEQIQQLSLYVHSRSYALDADEYFIFNILHGKAINHEAFVDVVSDALSTITHKVTFDKVILLRPIDKFTREQLAEYHAFVAASDLRAASVM